MPRYAVKATYSVNSIIFVDANNVDDAIEEVSNTLSEDDFDFELADIEIVSASSVDPLEESW